LFVEDIQRVKLRFQSAE